MNPVIIDNCVVSFNENIIHICSIKLMKKKYPNLNIDSLQIITYGSKLEDNRILSQLVSGLMSFDDLFN